MALFKILRGESSAFTTDLLGIEVSPPFVDGYCYFLPDTGMFYIDYDDGQKIISYNSVDIAKVNFILPEGKTYYTFNFDTNMYEEYTGNYNLLEEYGEDNLPTHYYYYQVSLSQHRIPLNANEAKAVQSVRELNKGLDQKFWRGTKAEYDALAIKNDDTLYLVSDQFDVIEATYMDQNTYDPQQKKTDIFKYSEDTHKTPKTGLILTDSVNGKNYVISMVNGNLISRPYITSLRIKTNPSKMAYSLNESFDPTGMIIEAVYEDGTIEEIDFYSYNTIVTDFNFSIYYNQAGNIIETILELTER